MPQAATPVGLHATCYVLHATCYMLHATCYMLHATLLTLTSVDRLYICLARASAIIFTFPTSTLTSTSELGVGKGSH